MLHFYKIQCFCESNSENSIHNFSLLENKWKVSQSHLLVSESIWLLSLIDQIAEATDVSQITYYHVFYYHTTILVH